MSSTTSPAAPTQAPPLSFAAFPPPTVPQSPRIVIGVDMPLHHAAGRAALYAVAQPTVRRLAQSRLAGPVMRGRS